MTFTRTIFNRSVFFLALIPLFAIWGFWVTYFTRPPETMAIWHHLHGYAMFAWALLLVLQSFLVRSGHRAIHRQTGKLAYLLAPWIIISTILLAHYTLNVRGLTPEGFYVLGLQLSALIQYTVFITLAIRHRKQSDLHARWMICTALSMLDPIFARILMINFIPVPLETGVVQYAAYTLIDLIVIGLVLRDWKAERRRDVFLPAFVLILVTQALTLLALRIPVWKDFAAWFISLSLT